MELKAKESPPSSFNDDNKNEAESAGVVQNTTSTTSPLLISPSSSGKTETFSLVDDHDNAEENYTTATHVAACRDHGPLISALSNLSIQYNLGVIAPALMLLDPRGATSSPGGAAYPRSDTADSLLKSSVFAGAILGQCSFGFIGDTIGLENAMLVSNGAALLGTVLCTIAPVVGGNNASNVYRFLAFSRALLGVGVGGKYPLASALRAQSAENFEGSSNSSNEYNRHDRAKEVARGFFWQTPGAILPYVVCLLSLLMFGENYNGKEYMRATNLQYALLVGLGIVPSLGVLVLTRDQLRRRAETFRSPRTRSSQLLIRLQDPLILKKLIGTGFSWFLYDFVYYGTAFNQPDILAKVFHGTGLVANSWQNIIVGSMGIPGVLCAIWMLMKVGPKALQGWGFVAIGGVSAILSLCVKSDATEDMSAFIACCLLIFTLNWGCNVSTYVLPMETYPREIRSSLHGVSAGIGKLGALVGSYSFTPLNEISMSLTFGVCSLVCFVGILVTWRFVEPFSVGAFSPLREGGRPRR